LRDTHYPGAERLGHGQGYQYAHDFPGHFVVQDYLGADKRYYEPSEQGVEKKIKERVERWRALKAQSQNPKTVPPPQPGAARENPKDETRREQT
jgi:putative ATPase